MLYICNVCNTVHTESDKAHKCARECIQGLEGSVFECGEGFYCPVCEMDFGDRESAIICMECCYFLKYGKTPFEEVKVDNDTLPLCPVCTHSDEHGKTYTPCPQHVFCEEMKSQCANFEPDVRTFGTKLATDFRLHNLGMEG